MQKLNLLSNITIMVLASPSQFCFVSSDQFFSISRCVHQSSLNLKLMMSRKIMAHPVHASFDFHSPLSNRGFTNTTTIYSRNTNSLLVPLSTKSSGPRGEDHKALETVLKFYDAIKSRNLQELSNLIGDECLCVSNFFSSFHPFQGKKQVLELFSFLMRYMGSDIQFVVEPALQEGMNIGVTWRLEWEKTHVPLGKGFSFYTCHTYQGRVVIRDMKMFMEPLLHIEPLRLIMMTYVASILEKIGSYSFIKGNGKCVTYLLLSLVAAITSLCLLKRSLF